MKRNVLLSIAFMSVLGIFAQNSIPNPSFEQWVNNNQPVGWYGLYLDLIFQQFHTLSKTTDAQHGNFAARIETIDASLLGALPGLASLSQIELDLMTGLKIKTAGTPFTAKATKVSGYFKYLQQGSDSGAVIVTFTKWNSSTNMRDTVFIGGFIVNQPITNYTQFNVNVSLGAQQPDSMNILFISSAGYAPQIGSALLVDNLSVTIDNTGIEEVLSLSGQLYPNPAIDYVFITVPEPGTSLVEIFDASGKKVKNISYDHQSFMLDVSDLSKGLYLILINHNGNIYKDKLFKQ